MKKLLIISCVIVVVMCAILVVRNAFGEPQNNVSLVNEQPESIVCSQPFMSEICDPAQVSSNCTKFIDGAYQHAQAPSPLPDQADIIDSSTAIADFSQSLFRELLNGEHENVIFSPLSLYYVLAMVALGAGGETAYEFQTVLGLDPLFLASELMYLTQSLLYTSGDTTLNIVASIWVNNEHIIHPDFNQAMTRYFSSCARPRDFSGNVYTTIDEINQWVYNQTYGLIVNPITEIDPDDLLLLINALYISAQWPQFFQEVQDVFYPESGYAQDMTFLKTDVLWTYASVTDTYEAVLLTYNDNRLALFMVRPVCGISVRDFTIYNDIMAIYNRLDIIPGGFIVRMPQLDKMSELKMNDYLMTMGFSSIFCPYTPSDFSGLLQEALDECIYIREAMQVARIITTRYGTEAAAVSIARPALTTGSCDLFPPRELNFNTPYLYMIIDTETGIPLFVGVVDVP